MRFYVIDGNSQKLHDPLHSNNVFAITTTDNGAPVCGSVAGRCGLLPHMGGDSWRPAGFPVVVRVPQSASDRRGDVDTQAWPADILGQTAEVPQRPARRAPPLELGLRAEAGSRRTGPAPTVAGAEPRPALHHPYYIDFKLSSKFP